MAASDRTFQGPASHFHSSHVLALRQIGSSTAPRPRFGPAADARAATPDTQPGDRYARPGQSPGPVGQDTLFDPGDRRAGGHAVAADDGINPDQ